MDIEGSRKLPVDRQQAWTCLNDPEVLKACIPGCEKMEASGENEYAVGLAVKVGPVAARFAGRVSVTELIAPESYVLLFEGQGGVAGFGKGRAKVVLVEAAEAPETPETPETPEPAETADTSACELRYTAHAQVGGRIAQVGQRLIDGVARSMAEEFFKRLEAELQRRYAAAAGPGNAAGSAESAGAGEGADQPPAQVAKPGLMSRLWRGSGD